MLRLEDFEAWLNQHDDIDVGFACDATRCPIAEFLAETHDEHSEDSVSVLFTEYTVGCETRVLPDWAERFVNELDEIYEEEFVKGWQALKILERVK